MATIDNIQGGKFQDAGGNVLNGGSISFRLSQQAQTINDGQAVQNTTISFTLNSSGSVASATALYGNDQLTPNNTYYIVNIYNAAGKLVRGPENWVLAGTSPIDLGTIVSTTPTTAFSSNFVSLTPTADQTILADNLLPSTSNTTQSLGSAVAPWNGVFNTQKSIGAPNFTITGFTDVVENSGFGTFPFTSQILLTNGGTSNGCHTAVGLAVPSNSTLLTCAPVMSLANSLSTFSNVCGIYANSVAKVTGANVWGANFLVQDTVSTSAAVVQGCEVDVNVLGTPALVRGLLIAGSSSGTMPSSSGNALQITMNGTPWNRGLVIQNVSGQAIVIQPPATATSGANSPAPSIQIISSEWTGSVAQLATWQIAPTIAASGAPTTDTLDITSSGSVAAAGQRAVRVPNLGIIGKLTSYNGSNTTNNGVPVELFSLALTAQSAAQTNTAFFTVPADGQYRISFNSKVTQVATASSTLGGAGGFTVTYTDQFDATANCVATSLGGTNAGNALTSVTSGSVLINAKAGSAVTVSYGYTSSGATAMKYYIQVLAEAI